MKLLKTPEGRRRIRQFFFLVGLILFVWLIYKQKPTVILTYLSRVGFNFIYILAVGLAWYVAYSLAWEIFLKRLSTKVRLWDIFKIKIAGEAVNNITPLSWGGGDPVRILLIKDHIPVNEGTASVVVDRTLNNLAIALFMLIGVFLTFVRFKLPLSMELSLILTLAFMVGAALFVYLRSKEGLFQFGIDVLRWTRIKKSFSPKTLENVADIDEKISSFYKLNKLGFISAFGLHFFGRLCGVIEIYVAAWFLGTPLTWVDSYLLASVAVIVNMLFVFIPSAMGVMEGAFAGIFALLKMDPAIGTSIQIVRRARTLFWTGLGFFFIAPMKRKNSP